MQIESRRGEINYDSAISLRNFLGFPIHNSERPTLFHRAGHSAALKVKALRLNMSCQRDPAKVRQFFIATCVSAA
jgi:hypothetical protein